MRRKKVNYAMKVVRDLRAINRAQHQPGGFVPIFADIRDVMRCWWRFKLPEDQWRKFYV